MERYVGLDAHARSCTLGVMSAAGQRLKSVVVETNGSALIEAVHSIPGRVHLCLEEGTQSAWLCDLLRPHVAEVVVAVALERKGPKDDQRDAWARANELRTGSIETRVYKAPEHLAGLRNAVSPAGSGARRGSLASATIRPLQEAARTAGQSILLTTHFSGASQLIPSVRPTFREGAERTLPAIMARVN